MRICASILVFAIVSQSAFAQSPYAAEQQRGIKSLSAERIEGLEEGRGLGYAKPAELNGYPGPMHVLELAEELALDADQRRRTQALYETMRERAAALGRELIGVEAELDRGFAESDVSRERLVELVSKSARIEGQIRLVHLQAHLQQVELLDDQQLAEYMRLRGYTGETGEHPPTHKH